MTQLEEVAMKLITETIESFMDHPKYKALVERANRYEDLRKQADEMAGALEYYAGFHDRTRMVTRNEPMKEGEVVNININDYVWDYGRRAQDALDGYRKERGG